jgi:hypothetical protein
MYGAVYRYIIEIALGEPSLSRRWAFDIQNIGGSNMVHDCRFESVDDAVDLWQYSHVV